MRLPNKLEVPPNTSYNICMMNEIDKGLRGLGGTKVVTSYTDLVLNAYDCVKDISNDNKCEFDMNLDLFLEGLKEDIYDAKAGNEFGCRPKEEQDVE